MELISNDDFIKALGINSVSAKKFSKVIFKLLKLHQINSLYSSSINESALLFIENLFREMQIEIEYDEEELDRIPLTGKFVSISNHPYGALDGLILMYIIAKRRKDVKIFANYILHHIEPIRDLIIPIDPFEDKPRTTTNMRALLTGYDHLKNGSPIAIFPVGEVSSMKKLNMVTDKEWSVNTVKFIRNVKAPVVPIYFHGTNSLAFHFLGMINPKLRTLKLPSEFVNKKHKKVRVRIGNLIPVEEQLMIEDTKELSRYFRAKTYSLGTSLNVNKFYKFNISKLKTKYPIVEEIHPLVIVNELAQLDPSEQLIAHGNYKVYCTSADRIPSTIMEIGRLREITFRAAGEGTNKPLDIDEFDINYKHLFIWDEVNHKIVGAYRIGLGQELFKLHKKRAFYLNTLFSFSKEFEATLKQSIELGRSFVVKEYQKRPFPLFLLWKGILNLLVKHPEYRYILGPVSISDSYTPLSKSLIVDYLSQHHFDFKNCSYVKARKGYKVKYKSSLYKVFAEQSHSLKNLDNIIEDIEQKKHKLPILIKKYLHQNAKILAFNKDPKFNNSVDGLMILDVFNIPINTLKDLGKESNDPEKVTQRFYSQYFEKFASVPQA